MSDNTRGYSAANVQHAIDAAESAAPFLRKLDLRIAKAAPKFGARK